MKKKRLVDRAIAHIIKCKPLDFPELNVNAIANKLSVSVPHLSRDFKKNMNISLHEYIIREKIKRSCFLLKQNLRVTIKEVSKIFDFCSCDYFIKIFKKYVGVTPGEFRKIDNSFYGLCDRRKGLMDRRNNSNKQILNPLSGKKNRRHMIVGRRISGINCYQ